MEIISSKYLLEVTYYSKEALLNYLKEKAIKVYNFQIVDTYIFRFEIAINEYKYLKNDLKSIKIINEIGVFMFLKKQLFKRVTIFSLIVSCCLFIFFSTLLIKINVNGSSKSINQEIREYLYEQDIKIYRFKPSIEQLNKIKDNYYLTHLDTFETIDFIIKGNALYVSYSLKKSKIEIEEKHGKMYAKKDAIIDKISISCGNVLVKEQQFVKKGELIVDDYLYYKDTPIYVGTRGLIYGYTYETILVSTYYEGNKDDVYIYLLDESRRKVSIDFENEEHIEKEIINDFYEYENNIYLLVSYSLYENIVFY